MPAGAQLRRINACVNACAGMVDPVTEVEALRKGTAEANALLADQQRAFVEATAFMERRQAAAQDARDIDIAERVRDAIAAEVDDIRGDTSRYHIVSVIQDMDIGAVVADIHLGEARLLALEAGK